MLSDVKLQYLTYLTCGREREERRGEMIERENTE